MIILFYLSQLAFAQFPQEPSPAELNSAFKIVFLENNRGWKQAPSDIGDFWDQANCSLGLWRYNQRNRKYPINRQSLTREGLVRARAGSYNALFPETLTIAVSPEKQTLTFSPRSKITSILTLGPIPYSHSITLPTTIIQPGFKMELSFLVQGSLDGQPGWDRYLFECE